MELLTKLVFIALVVAALWWAIQPRYVFVIRLEGGVPRVAKGQVPAAFLQQLGQACAELGVSRGWVAGAQRGRRLTLAFSRSVPPPCRQRLRNLTKKSGPRTYLQLVENHWQDGRPAAADGPRHLGPPRRTARARRCRRLAPQRGPFC